MTSNAGWRWAPLLHVSGRARGTSCHLDICARKMSPQKPAALAGFHVSLHTAKAIILAFSAYTALIPAILKSCSEPRTHYVLAGWSLRIDSHSIHMWRYTLSSQPVVVPSRSLTSNSAPHSMASSWYWAMRSSAKLGKYRADLFPCFHLQTHFIPFHTSPTGFARLAVNATASATKLTQIY